MHNKDWNYIIAPFHIQKIYSERHKKLMPYTRDKHKFRGDKVEPVKDPLEFRIFVLGGSTVQDSQPDEEMLTNQLKLSLPPDKNIKVINAGLPAYSSTEILRYYKRKIKTFKPDLVLYYEA